MQTTRDKLADIIEEGLDDHYKASIKDEYEIADQILALPAEGWKFKCQTYGSAKEYAEANVCDKCEWKDKCSVMGYRPATIAEILSGEAVKLAI